MAHLEDRNVSIEKAKIFEGGKISSRFS